MYACARVCVGSVSANNIHYFKIYQPLLMVFVSHLLLLVCVWLAAAVVAVVAVTQS